MKKSCLFLALAFPLPICAMSIEPIFTATFVDPAPTRHGALGAGHEWDGLAGAARGEAFSHTLPDGLVFEDLKPHITDLDRDGNAEALVVEMSATSGGRLALWDQTGRLAAGPFIGEKNRWLAVIGAADLDGDGVTEVAYVETPHIAPVLKLAHLQGDSFVTIAEVPGFTNHRFGADVIESAIIHCGTSAVILVASQDWTRVVAVRLENGRVVSTDYGPYIGPESFTNLPDCN